MTLDDAVLEEEAVRLGVAPERFARELVLERLLRRVASSPSAGDFVLRGGMLTCAWIGRQARPTQDLDFAADFPFDVQATRSRFRPVIEASADDGIEVAPGTFIAKGIWLQSEFPGVRLSFRAGWRRPDQSITVDVGFGDPLVPEPIWVDYPAMLNGQPFRARAARPETMLAWKLHGLAEMAVNWRPKDLADLWLLSGSVAWAPPELATAIGPAFQSRGMAPGQAAGCLKSAHWTTKTARVRWADFRGETEAPVPESLTEAVADVQRRLAPVLETLDPT